MAKSDFTSMNVSALKLKDPHLKEILDTAAHVALYNYNPESQNWEKTEVEGAFFIYSRTTEPQYYAFIMNRLSTSNHIEHIDENVDLQLHEPFILYKNAKGIIHGIWFYDRNECGRIAALIERLSSEIAKSKKVESLFPRNTSTLVSKEETNKRVMDFFARAGSQTPMVRPAPPMASTTSMNEVNPLVQRLLSTSVQSCSPNSVQTLEEIEKRHKMGQVQEDRTSGAMGLQSGVASSAPVAIQRQVSETLSSLTLENGLYLRVANTNNESPTPPLSNSIPTQCFFNSSLRQAASPNPNSDVPLEVSVLERGVMDPPSIAKPALLPPGMFTSNDQPLGMYQVPPTASDPTMGLQPPISYQPPGAGTGDPALTPLTKPQLLQAVNYLLKNDADFLNKLHEAYVKSFVDMVS